MKAARSLRLSNPFVIFSLIKAFDFSIINGTNSCQISGKTAIIVLGCSDRGDVGGCDNLPKVGHCQKKVGYFPVDYTKSGF